MRSVAEALAASVGSVFGIVKRTAEAGSRELLLVEAQDELVRPSEQFRAEAAKQLEDAVLVAKLSEVE